MNLDTAFADARIPAAVAMVGASDGVRWQAAFGAATVDSVFQLASMTKAVTSVAAMQLVERGQLHLDAPLAGLLPRLETLQVLAGFAGDGRAMYRPAARAITLRQLLAHTSGMGYFFAQPALAQAGAGQEPPAPGTLASIEGPLLFDPGDSWDYGVSTDWVGLAVEAASGQKLDAYFAEHIFGPLGMTDTTFRLDAGQHARLVPMQARTPDGGLTPFPIDIGGGPNVEFLSGGGGLSGTGSDYMRFARMILNHGSLDGATVLQPATVAEMSRNQIGPLRAGAIPTVLPAFSLAVDWFPGMHTGWGLGFMINPETGPDGRGAGSLAWAGIANTHFWIDPANDVAAMLLMQVMPFADPAALGLLSAFERAVYS